jgi:multidrug efflux pump subunit AcrB
VANGPGARLAGVGAMYTSCPMTSPTSRARTGRGVGLVLAFAYIVLAAQFESFVHPLTIMVSMFLAIPFGIVTLLVLGKTLNIYSIMGLFLLMGVV